MDEPTIPYERHVFVCTNERAAEHPRGCCAAKDSAHLRERLKTLVKERKISGVRINGAGCLDFCEHGAVIVVYPENVWYGRVTDGDLREIVDSHLLAGHPVERLRLPPNVLSRKP